MGQLRVYNWLMDIKGLLLDRVHLWWLAGNITAWVLFRSEANVYLYLTYLFLYIVGRLPHGTCAAIALVTTIICTLFLF